MEYQLQWSIRNEIFLLHNYMNRILNLFIVSAASPKLQETWSCGAIGIIQSEEENHASD